MKPIEVWFSIGSTYSYLSLMRMEGLEATHGVTFTLHPFSVRVLMTEMDNIPFANKPAKAAYMWRDIERRAAAYGLPARLPAPYPLQGFDIANRVAILAAREGWLRPYVMSTYRQWFQKGDPAGREPNISNSIAEAGEDPPRVLEDAAARSIHAAYTAATDAARAKGIFGAPTFIVDDELFWGDDRMEEAIAWRRAHPG